MNETSRRNLLKVTAIGGVSAALGLAVGPEQSGGGSIAAAEKKHSHRKVSGPLANATMTFGSWETDPPFDRFENPTPSPPMPTRNHHPVTPDEVTIQSEGTVNFIIGGFHLLVIYDHGTKPEDIKLDLLVPGFPPGLIDDPNKRIYRGLDPRMNPQDRVEAVNFSRPGTYLVICGVLPHFVEGMFGYVRVVN